MKIRQTIHKSYLRIKSKDIIYLVFLMSFLLIQCKEKDSIKPIEKIQEVVNFEQIYNSLVSEYQPKVISLDEFSIFKKKSNYIEVIKAYDLENPPKIFGGESNVENIRYYELPTKINTQEYGNNGFVFGDLNGDNKRDCIISVFRSDGYNEVTFFYVFINNGETFNLVDVTNENEICGCKKEVWPNIFRYQVIKNGFLHGISQCHYKDAHCCPSLTFKTKIEFKNGKLKFYSSEFVMDDSVQYRPTPRLGSVLVGY